MKKIFLLLLALNGCLGKRNIVKNKCRNIDELSEEEKENIMRNTKESIESRRFSEDYIVCDISSMWNVHYLEALRLKDKEGKNALIYAVESNNEEAFDTLITYGIVPESLEEYMVSREALEYAVLDGKIAAAEMILDSGFDVNSGNFLNLASYRGMTEMVKFLISRGADINTAGSCAERSPIMDAASSGKKDIVEILINCGANLDLQDEYGDTALNLSFRYSDLRDDVVKMLILAGADVNKINKQNRTSLMIMINNHLGEEIIKMVVERSSNINFKSKNGETAIFLATTHGRYEIVELLIDKIESVDSFTKDENLSYLLELAAYYAHEKIFDLILSKGAKLDGNAHTLLRNAASSDSVEMLKKILEIYKEEDILKKYGSLVLLNSLYFSRAMKTSKFLIERDVDINFVDEENKSAISILLYNQMPDESEIINLLIEKGIDLNRTIQNKEKALNLSVQKGYSRLVSLLLKTAFNPKEGINLLRAVISGSRNFEILVLLIKEGANLKLVGEDYLKIEIEPMREALDRLLYVSENSSLDKTLVHKSLIKIKKNNFKSETKENILDIFRVFHSHFSIAEIMKIIKIFKLKEEDFLEISGNEVRDNKVLSKLRDFCDFCKISINLIFDE